MSPPNKTTEAPKVIFWYRLYAIFMFIIYLGVIVLVSLGWFLDEKTLAEEDIPRPLFFIYMFLLYGISLILAGGFGFALFLKPKPWTWVYHLVMICIGLTSACCMPISIPLLIFWIKEDVRVYFGRIPS